MYEKYLFCFGFDVGRTNLNLGFQKARPASIEDFKTVEGKLGRQWMLLDPLQFNNNHLKVFGIACKTTNIGWKLERGRKDLTKFLEEQANFIC
ncbi:hypothetical protein L2E82_25437 [Cichorium intybus]|uniref:Uncharacterized protein n=1 Tax=Cichorium intybus TaxID=13427 RepID=A0ACB9E3X3_CICIN|nr:hypothetical protein L2E82_25437 [Cichorium intybus]